MAIESIEYFDDRPEKHPISFTMAGDGATNIGEGQTMRWNFANADDEVTDSITTTIPPTAKRKRMEIRFNDNIKLRGTYLYFKDAPKKCWVDLWRVCKTNGYYEDPNGTVPGDTIGRNPKKMFTQATSHTPVTRIITHHIIQGSDSDGIRLVQDDQYEFGLLRRQDKYVLWLEITTPDTDTSSNGHCEFELRRERTRLLPGESI